jgi:NAD(P)-dependent dehydrogenase (short-subunit alcohol dehydrogenase family)
MRSPGSSLIASRIALGQSLGLADDSLAGADYERAVTDQEHPMQDELSNQLANQSRGVLITGAGRGLGEALARELAARGDRVVLVARTEAEVTAVAAAIRAAGGEAHALAADVADKDAVFAIAGSAAALVGHVDVLVHNAGDLGPVPLRLLADTPCEALQRALEVNVLGPFRLTKAIVGAMLLRGRGLVAHVSTDAAVGAYPGWGAYGASKAALDHLQRIWAAELAGTGVRFVGFDPGEMDTRMHRDAVPDADPASLRRPADVARAIADRIADPALPSGARVEVALAGGAR